jgi:ABC-type polysaccharide/polyol phosphate export permease
MFEKKATTGTVSATFEILELVYHNAAHHVRKQHRNAVIAILMSVLQSVATVAVFYVMFSFLGIRGAAIRGDFLLYIMSGVFMFFTHVKAITAVYGSEGPASPIMQHLPMTTAIAIASAALSALYVQVLTVVLILSIYHLGWGVRSISTTRRARSGCFCWPGSRAWPSGCCSSASSPGRRGSPTSSR